MTTLTERIAASTSYGGSATFISGDEAVTVPWTEVHEDAKAMAAALQARGVEVGDHVAVLGPTTRSLVTLIQATWLAGGTIVLLPLPMRLSSIEEFVRQTRTRVARADVALLVVDEQLADFIDDEPGDPARVNLDVLAAEARSAGAAALSPVPADPERLAILQFTSGSTSEPKGVMLPDKTVCANLDAICEAGELGDDVFVSWLPLYHDMGLVGMLCIPMTTGRDLVLGAPQDFTARPARWMQWISTYGGTVTAGPNFAYALAARGLARSKETLDLSKLRLALNGAEPVDPATVEAFVEAGERHGLRPGAVFPAFGMAEVSIGGAFPPLMAGLRTDVVDRRVVETERYAAPVNEDAPHAKHYALLGFPLPGLEMHVVDPATGKELAEREVGELEIRGTSVTSGYYRNPEATAELFRDGWMRTGDLAYMLGGELVICGRIKDVIIVGGRNVFPEDVERAVAHVEGIRMGNVIAFGVEGRRGQEAMVVVAETKGERDIDAMHREVLDVARHVTGLPASKVVLVPPGTLPKTSSGKLQRSLCRQRFLAGELEVVGTSA